MTRSLTESLGGGLPAEWAADFLVAAHFPVTAENVRAVVSWEIAESGGGGGMWNPLNTTQGGFSGSTNANSVGVKNYKDRADGLAANAKVIHNGFYPDVVAAFTRGTSARVIVNAIVVSPWGTRHINLVDHVDVPTDPHAPLADEDEMPSFPAPGKPPLKFKGAKVNLAAKQIHLVGGATMEPAGPPHNPNPWGGAYARLDGKPGFVIWTTGDLDEYHYLLH